MRTVEQLLREIGEMDCINPDMKPVVGSSLLQSGGKFKVQVYITIYDMLGKGFRERKTITIPETVRNKAELKRADIHKRVEAVVDKKFNEMQEAENGTAGHELISTMYDWVRYHEELDDWAATTLSSYKDKLKTIQTYFGGGEFYVEDIGASDITDFSRWALKNGRVRPRHNEDGTDDYGLSYSTVKDLHGMLYNFFKYAIEYRKDINVKYNPCRDSSIPKESKKKIIVDTENKEYLMAQIEADKDKWMDVVQYKQFRQWLIDNTDKYKYRHLKKMIEIVEVLIFTGMRREELAGLRWYNINFEKGMLYIGETRVRAGNIEYSVGGCKTEASIRSYKLPKEKVELFSQIAQRQKKLGIFDKNNYVFIWEHDDDNHGIKAGMPYKVDYLTKTFKKAVTHCPYVSSKLTLHKTRHSCCSILFCSGWSMKEVQSWLGHKDGSKITEQVYNHYRQVIRIENIDNFNERLK